MRTLCVAVVLELLQHSWPSLELSELPWLTSAFQLPAGWSRPAVTSHSFTRTIAGVNNLL